MNKKALKFLFHHTMTAELYTLYRHIKDVVLWGWMSDTMFAKIKYYRHGKKHLNLKSPRTFDEKLWYLKFHENEPLKTKCTDKYLVRDYVKECGLEEILIQSYGVYSRFEEIPFEQMPDRFYIKCTHTSGQNCLFDRNKLFDYVFYKNKMNCALKRNYSIVWREGNYRDIKPRIICEEVLEDRNGKAPLDYKFMCFGGKVKLMFLCLGLSTETGEHAENPYCNIYDRNFQLLPIKDERENISANIPCPKNWEQMIRYAEKLSGSFRHCRVDLYDVDDRIYFGEITFFHGAGCNGIEPEEWSLRMGDWVSIEGL